MTTGSHESAPVPILFGTGFAHFNEPHTRGVALPGAARIIVGMAGKRREEVAEKDLTGLKYFDRLAPLLARLHDDACQRDKAGNRQLHFDQYMMLVLLFLFNPIVTSLRAIVQASELNKVQRRLGCPRASLGSLSEAACVLDAQRLKGIVEELGGGERRRKEKGGQARLLTSGSHERRRTKARLSPFLPRVERAWIH